MEIKKLHFEQYIEAPEARVWEVMLGEETYPKWTSEFSPSSRFEGSWEQGEKIQFLDDSGSGMYAEIAENRPHEFLSIRHLGMINEGKIDTESDEVKAWASAYENYTFEEKDGGTLIKIDQDITAEYEEMFLEMWPRALKKLKSLCEVSK